MTEIIDNKFFENILEKPTVTNVCKLFSEVKKHNEILSSYEISSKTNHAKRKKSNCLKNSNSIDKIADETTKLRKIARKGRGDMRTAHKTTILNSYDT